MGTNDDSGHVTSAPISIDEADHGGTYTEADWSDGNDSWWFGNGADSSTDATGVVSLDLADFVGSATDPRLGVDLELAFLGDYGTVSSDTAVWFDNRVVTAL